MYADGRLTRRGQVWRAGLIGGVLLNLLCCGLLAGRLIEWGQPTVAHLGQRLFPPPQIIYVQAPPVILPAPAPAVTVVYIIPTPVP
jgi:hypothetical protein